MADLDVVTYLLARVEEEERRAQAIICARDVLPGGSGGALYYLPQWDTPAMPTLIAYWDPTRVLAEAAAKRAILDLHRAEEGQHPDFCGHDMRELPCPTLLAIAQPYASRDDFNPAWRTKVQHG